MKKINMKFCFVMMIFVFAMFTCNNYTYASTLQEKFDKVRETITMGKNNNTFELDDDTIKVASNVMYSVITGLGIIVAVIWGGRIAIGFMIAGAEDKANYKEQLVPYVIGMIVLFSSFTIWKIVLGFLENIK